MRPSIKLKTVQSTTVTFMFYRLRMKESSGLAWWLSGKESACKCRIHKFNPWVRKISGEGNGNPFQYSGLENSMDRGAWWATVHGVAKCQTRLGD